MGSNLSWAGTRGIVDGELQLQISGTAFSSRMHLNAYLRDARLNVIRFMFEDPAAPIRGGHENCHLRFRQSLQEKGDGCSEGISLQERLRLTLVQSKILKSGCMALGYLKQ